MPTLQPATAADLPAIAQLMNAAYRGQSGWTSETHYLQGDRTAPALLQADLDQSPDALLLLLRTDAHGSAPIACLWLQPISPETWYLGSLTVDPTLQNAGLGRQLLAEAEAWAAAHGAHTLRITVINIRHTLIAWYQRRGYQLTGETLPFPYHDTRFGIPTRNDLTFLCLEKSLNNNPSMSH